MKFAFLRSKHRNLAGLMIASVLALAACGGGGGGGDHGGGGLASGTFTRTFSPASSGGNQVPFGIGLFGDVTYQGLYTAAEVGGSGRITTLRFQNVLANPGPITCPNTTIRLGHSNLAALTATFASNTNVGTAQVVLNNATVNVPAAAGAWFDIALTTPFDYSGVDNLVVQVDRTTVCSGAAVFGVDNTSIASRRAWSAATDTTPGTAQNNTTTGAVDTEVVWMQFVFAGGDDRVLAADRGGNNGNFLAPSATGRAQFLILASDITGSGPITGIQFRPFAALAAPLSGTNKITLSHVAAATTQLGSTTFASNVGSGATVVAENVAVSLPVGTTEWWVPLSGSFSYDGTSNLLIDVESTMTGGGADFLLYQNASGTRILTAAAPTDVTGGLISRGLEPKLRFHGGQLVVVPAAPGSNSTQILGSTFTSTGGQIQSLYRNDLIGTSGTINAIYVRMLGASVAAAVPNYKLFMGHTAKTTYVITDTYASNMNENATVFTGTLNVPAGLIAGDWVKIALASPFAYDSTKNLSIFFSSDFAVLGNAVTARQDANQFPVNVVGRNDNAVTTSGTPAFTFNGIIDIAVDLSK